MPPPTRGLFYLSLREKENLGAFLQSLLLYNGDI